MEAGEKEVRKIFEDMVTDNVKRVVEHSNETRNIVRELEKKVERLERVTLAQNETIEQLRNQLAAVQTIVFRGGTV